MSPTPSTVGDVGLTSNPRHGPRDPCLCICLPRPFAFTHDAYTRRDARFGVYRAGRVVWQPLRAESREHPTKGYEEDRGVEYSDKIPELT